MASINKKSLFLFFFSLVYFSCSLPYLYGDLGIDASWHESLVMSINKNLIFGKDFIFNYGPLGYLNTLLLPKAVSPFLMLAFHLFILCNYLFIIKLSIDKAGNKWPWVAILAIIVYLPWGFFADSSFTLFYLLIFWLCYFNHTKSYFAVLLGILICTLIFFIKVNLSIIAIGVLLVSLGYFIVAKKLSTVLFALSLINLSLGIYCLSIVLNVDIYHYLYASTKIIDAYQDAMSTMILSKKELLVVLFFTFLILLLVLIYVFFNIAYFFKNVFLYLLIGLAWFLCFKQAFTATGHYNVFGFFLFMPPLALLIYLFAVETKHKSLSGKLFIIILFTQIIATQFIRLAYTSYKLKDFSLFYFPDSLKEEISSNPLQIIKVLSLKNPYNYVDKLLNYSYEHNFNRIKYTKERQLPKSILSKIGNNTVDILPYEISYLFFNQLNYNPRPIIQTYQANSDWLAEQNENKYFSNTAPKYVFANVSGFREQNAYWVDKGAYLSLFYNYNLIDTAIVNSDTLYLFEKAKSLRLNKKLLITNKTATFSETIATLSSINPIYLKANVEYSFLGKLARLFFQPPYLYATLEYENGKNETFRIPPSILKGGILVNKKLTNGQDFVNYQLFKGLRSENIKNIRFEKRLSWGFKDKIVYSIEEIK